MKLQYNNYRERNVCEHCFSLSIKKSYKKYKCYTCGKTLNTLKKIELMHKGNRCIDNNVDTRKERYNKKENKVIYKKE